MERLLLIDDDANLCELLSTYLQEQGYEVHFVSNGRDGLRQLYTLHPDLVILDVTMPGMDGWETLKRIREISDLPVIMLTARDEEYNVLRGFSLGADDYVTKPFSFAQLGARVRAVLSRSRPKATNMLAAGNVQVDMETRRVYRGDELIDLTPTEFKLLVTLMQAPGKVFSNEEIARAVWGPQYISEADFVRRYIWHLRQKLEPDPKKPQYIHNERGFGYRFAVQDE